MLVMALETIRKQQEELSIKDNTAIQNRRSLEKAQNTIFGLEAALEDAQKAALEILCVGCMKNRKQVLTLPCQHVALCGNCYDDKHAIEGDEICCVLGDCRAPVTSVKNVYFD
jgi:hypothetical protein